MKRHDNAWLRSLGRGGAASGEQRDGPFLTVLCVDQGDEPGRPVAAVTRAELQSGESVYLLHRSDGSGVPLADAGAFLAPCRCVDGHRLDLGKVSERVRGGVRRVTVSDVAYGS